MQNRSISLALISAVSVLGAVLTQAGDRRDTHPHDGHARRVQLGPRPYYLVEGMDDSPLKRRLKQCANGPFSPTDFSIGHRGACLQFPEHSKESYDAAARMGAGIVECDITFTSDGELVCRHSECDLHTTTNIVATDLNAKCSIPWSGPNQDPGPKCCTSDLTLEELKSLKAKMDASNPAATTPEDYLGGTPDFRTDLYTGHSTLVTFRESIAQNEKNRVKHTPELKSGDAARIQKVFGGQDKYAQKAIDVLEDAHVDPRDVFLQSFNPDDVLYWVDNAPAFGRQAVFLDSIDPTVNPPIPRLTVEQLNDLRQKGVRYFAPPMFALLAVNDHDSVVPSEYALDIRRAGFKIITWTFERADLRGGAANAGFYFLFDPEGRAIKKDSDMYIALDVLARKVKIEGIFSDWPATVTYYANCMGF
jgi:glycerophosphoryl diester phosphodiesterase